MFATRRDPNIVGAMVNESKLVWLGRGTDFDYATYKGTEYAVDRYPGNPEDYSRQRGELFVMRVRREVIDGSDFEHHQTHRAVPVPSGTYASLAAKAPKPAPEKPMRAWDALATLPIMQRREPLRLPTVPVGNNVTVGLWKAQHGKQPPVPYIEVNGNEPPERSPAGIIAHLERRGIALSLARGQLLARSRTPIRTDDKALIEQAEELIVGVLRGSPLLCSLCAAPAVSLAFPRAPMCAAHLEAPQ